MIYNGEYLTNGKGEQFQVVKINDSDHVKLLKINVDPLDEVQSSIGSSGEKNHESGSENIGNFHKSFMTINSFNDSMIMPYNGPQHDYGLPEIMTTNTKNHEVKNRYSSIIPIFQWKLLQIMQTEPHLQTRSKRAIIKKYLKLHTKQSVRLKPFLNSNTFGSGIIMREILDDILEKELNIKLVLFLCKHGDQGLLEFTLDNLLPKKLNN